jgi:hypothetical protein
MGKALNLIDHHPAFSRVYLLLDSSGIVAQTQVNGSVQEVVNPHPLIPSHQGRGDMTFYEFIKIICHISY